jgi:hypothetical protein
MFEDVVFHIEPWAFLDILEHPNLLARAAGRSVRAPSCGKASRCSNPSRPRSGATS